MSTPTPSNRLHLSLYPAHAALPEGMEVSTKLPGAATCQLDHGKMTAAIAVPERPMAEIRWIVDQLLRKLTGLVNVASVELSAQEGVDDDVCVALGLDLHTRTRGNVLLGQRGDLKERVSTIGLLEDEYRRWVNQDPSERTSLAIARDIADFAGSHDTVTVEVLAEPALRELGLRLLLAVGGASVASPPRLVIARYAPKGSLAEPLMLLGKGITFDTGGINLKPYESYVSMMKNDMAGSALAFSLFRGLVESRYPEPVVLVIPTCENAIDANAMRPGSLVQSYRGLTVRIDHTDAEGRLILADALAYCGDRFAPRQVLCFATLTTAALISYGPYATPVHFADAALTEALQAASARTGEDLHFFPERVWHYEANRDREADLRNTARLPGDAARGAGSRNAAHFFKHFTERPFCHFDIFASTWNWAGDAPGCGYGATGAPLRTLLRAYGIG